MASSTVCWGFFPDFEVVFFLSRRKQTAQFARNHFLRGFLFLFFCFCEGRHASGKEICLFPIKWRSKTHETWVVCSSSKPIFLKKTKHVVLGWFSGWFQVRKGQILLPFSPTKTCSTPGCWCLGKPSLMLRCLPSKARSTGGKRPRTSAFWGCVVFFHQKNLAIFGAVVCCCFFSTKNIENKEVKRLFIEY